MKKRKTMIIGSFMLVCALCLIVFYIIQNNPATEQNIAEPPPNPVADPLFNEGDLVKYVDTTIIDFEGYNNDVHRIDENRIYFSLQEITDNHISYLITRELGYVDVDDMEYHTLKVFEDDIRVWDYIYIGDTLVYSKVGSVTEEGIEIEIVMEKDGKITIVDTLKSIWTMDTPILTRFKDSVYYYAKHYEDVEENKVLTTFSLKSFDLESVQTVHEHTCYANLGEESIFDEGCLRGEGQIYATDDLVYYSETNGLTSVMQIYEPESKLFKSVYFDEYVTSTLAYFDQRGILISGFNVETLTDTADIYVYDVEKRERKQLIQKNVSFGRPAIYEDLLIFNSGFSTPSKQNIFVDLNSQKYQVFYNHNESVTFPKFYGYQNKVYAVWSDNNPIIEVYEIIR